MGTFTGLNSYFGWFMGSFKGLNTYFGRSMGKFRYLTSYVGRPMGTFRGLVSFFARPMRPFRGLNKNIYKLLIYTYTYCHNFMFKIEIDEKIYKARKLNK